MRNRYERNGKEPLRKVLGSAGQKNPRPGARWRTAIGLVACLAVVTAGCNATSARSPSSFAVARQDMTLNFGDYQSHAQLTYPDAGGRHPVVVLISGAAPEDRNAAVCSSPGHIFSHNFADIAEYLTARGYAVLRYDKRGVTGPCQGTGLVALPQLLTDAGTVLAAATNDPHVDPRHVFVYGWSEGAAVAAALVVTHPEISGLIIQAGAVTPWEQIFAYQDLQVGIPYLRSFAADGRVTTDVVRAAAHGNGGSVAKSFVYKIAAPSPVPGQYAISPRLDANHDGALDIDTEIIPAVTLTLPILVSPGGALHFYGPAEALPVLSQQAAKLTLPELFLQGKNDANVPAADAQKFQVALASKDKTLKLYPGLGHTLGMAPNVIGDNFAPITQQPLADLTAWLDGHRS